MLCIAQTLLFQDVRLSDTHRYCVEMAKYIIQLFYHSVATPFQFIHTNRYGSIPTATTLNVGTECMGNEKNLDLRRVSQFISKVIQDRAIITMECE